MIAAGADLKAIPTAMGHSSITITHDRYGHLLPGSVRELGAKMDAYLEGKLG
jgi:site-specific recombinase XerD